MKDGSGHCDAGSERELEDVSRKCNNRTNFKESTAVDIAINLFKIDGRRGVRNRKRVSQVISARKETIRTKLTVTFS